MKVKELVLVSLALALVASLSSATLAAETYWKVVGWDYGDFTWTPLPQHAILEPQDCSITEPGYEWVSQWSVASPDPIHLMVRSTDPQVNQMIPGELFTYNGTDANGVPDLYYDILVCIPCSGVLLMSPLPPCLGSDPTSFVLNGNASSSLVVDCTEPMTFSTHEVPSPGGPTSSPCRRRTPAARSSASRRRTGCR